MKLATLCYIHNPAEKKTLMLHRVKKENDMHKDKYNGLGGKFEQGESPEECVIREVYEESGLTITNPRLKGFITFPAFDTFEDWYVFVYFAEEYSGEMIISGEGNLEWIDDDKLMSLNLWEGDKIFMPWIYGEKMFSAKFIYESGELVSHSVVFY